MALKTLINGGCCRFISFGRNVFVKSRLVLSAVSCGCIDAPRRRFLLSAHLTHLGRSLKNLVHFFWKLFRKNGQRKFSILSEMFEIFGLSLVNLRN